MMILNKAKTYVKTPLTQKRGERGLTFILPNECEGALPLWIFYLIGFAVVFLLKLYNSKAGSCDLEWILAPTACWVSILSGIPFENEPGVGYINHHFRFIIANSCSGVQFMLISIATLFFSFVHRMRTNKRRFSWLGLIILASYAVTILVNGLRIVLSIYLPVHIEKTGGYSSFLTPERLHTMIGITVYFTSLCVIYGIAEYVLLNIVESLPKAGSLKQMLFHGMVPLFWYFFIALGIPFLNKAYFKDRENFVEYAVLMTAVCMIVLSLLCIWYVMRKHFHIQKQFDK